MAMALRN
ncbi:hypothetical protein PybrP1_003087, partial [[Pythium] brassicae (nom. inval.)]